MCFHLQISFTGCGINPARSFGPALIRSQMNDHWVMSTDRLKLFISNPGCIHFHQAKWSWSLLSPQVYWLGPMCGGIAAALIYDFLLYPRKPNFRTRWYVLVHGPEDEDPATEVTAEDGAHPGSPLWPKHWITWVSILCLSTYIKITDALL